MADKEEILSKIDYRTVYSHYIPGLDTSKRQVTMSSPFREDNKPSFSLNLDTGLWNDFAEDHGGDLISFVQRHHQCNFNEALDILRSFTNIPAALPKNGVTSKKKTGLAIITASRYKVYKENLKNQKPRFIIDELKSRGIDTDTCRLFNVGISTYRNNPEIYFPLKTDKNGNVTRYKKYYYTDKNETKKLGSCGETGFFPESVLKSKEIVLCEGEYDALSLNSHGIKAVTQSGGANTFKKAWGEYFIGKDVTILYDNDTAGHNGAIKSGTVIFDYARSVKIAKWDRKQKGYDVGDFFKENRPVEDLYKILQDARDFRPMDKIAEEVRSEMDEDREHLHKIELEEIFYQKSASGHRLLHTPVAEYIKDNYKICSTDAGTRTVFFQYKEGYWEKISNNIVHKIILDLLYHSCTSSALRSIREILQSLVFVHPDRFNARTDLINLNNCAYDLKNYRPLPHAPEHYFTFKNEYDYRPEAGCPEFSKALYEYSLNDRQWYTAIWEIFGYSLKGDYDIQKMFWFTGSRGGNGKGTVTRVMQKLVGLKLTKPNFSPSKLGENFYKKALIGKRLAIAGDLPPFMRNIDIVKELTGGDRQATDVKFGDEEHFENTAKLVFAMNRLPSFPAGEPIKPILRRIYLLPFDYVINDYDHTIEKVFENELPGIFNKAIDGLKRLMKTREFTICDRGLKLLDIYQANVNTFEAFLDNKAKFDIEKSIWGFEIWEEYKSWMNEHAGEHWQQGREHITNMIAFGRELTAKHNVEARKEYSVDKSGSYIKYYGIALKSLQDFKKEFTIDIRETYDDPDIDVEQELNFIQKENDPF